MDYKKLLKEISVELSEAKIMYKQKHFSTMKACLLHMKHLIVEKIERKPS